jgi:hypothetical protein
MVGPLTSIASETPPKASRRCRPPRLEGSLSAKADFSGVHRMAGSRATWPLPRVPAMVPSPSGLQTFTVVRCKPAVWRVGDLRPGKPPESSLNGGRGQRRPPRLLARFSKSLARRRLRPNQESADCRAQGIDADFLVAAGVVDLVELVAATVSPLSRERPDSTTLVFSAANPFTATAPMPEVAPVTRATLSSRQPVIVVPPASIGSPSRHSVSIGSTANRRRPARCRGRSSSGSFA